MRDTIIAIAQGWTWFWLAVIFLGFMIWLYRDIDDNKVFGVILFLASPLILWGLIWMLF